MRIISGTFRGKIINAPHDLPARPTTDFAKTGLFNILANYVDFSELDVLDVFCGTGNISYEFGSRGTARITSVDENRNCIRFVNTTFEKLGMKEAHAIHAEGLRFLETQPGTYDIIFADPPFDFSGTAGIPEIVFDKKLLNENGWLIVEHQSKQELISKINPDEIRKYGNCAFGFYRARSSGF